MNISLFPLASPHFTTELPGASGGSQLRLVPTGRSWEPVTPFGGPVGHPRLRVIGKPPRKGSDSWFDPKNPARGCNSQARADRRSLVTSTSRPFAISQLPIRSPGPLVLRVLGGTAGRTSRIRPGDRTVSGLLTNSTVRGRAPVQINFHKQRGVSSVGMNPSPDETDVMDFHISLKDLCEIADADERRTQREQEAIDRLERTITRLTRRVNARGALESLFRNGTDSRYTNTKAKEAGLIVVAMDGHVMDIVPQEPITSIDPREPAESAIAA